MRWPDDEILMAYADRALGANEQRAVELALERDVAARRVVTIFKSTNAIASLAYDEPMWRPVPARLRDKIVNVPTGKFGGWVHLSRWSDRRKLVQLAAACLATVAISTAILLLSTVTEESDSRIAVAIGPLPSGSGLARALDALDERGSAGFDGRLVRVASLRDKWGHTCAEVDWFRTRPASTPDFAFVACRLPTSEWTVVGAVSPTAIAKSAREPYVSTDTQAHDALASVLTMMGVTQRASAVPIEGKHQ